MSYESPTVVTLGSLQFITSGVIQVQPANSWGEGIRQGSPDYGDVEHSFFKIYEDFRGGIGVHDAKARENVDDFFISQGLKTWQGGNRLVTTPLATSVSVSIAGMSLSWQFSGFPALQATVETPTPFNYLWVAAGSTVWAWDGATWVEEPASTNGGAPIVSHQLLDWTNQDNIRSIYYGHSYIDPSSLVEFGVNATRRFSVLDAPGVGAWSSINVPAQSFLDFDQKLLSVSFGNVRSSINGLSWVELMTVPGSPRQLASHPSKFVGVGPTPRGDLRPFLIRAGKLYVLDIVSRTYENIELGLQKITEGVVYQDEVVVTDGYSMKVYHPQRPVREIGFPSLKDYVENSVLTTTKPSFKTLFPYGPYLLASVEWRTGSTSYMQLWLWSGSSWHMLNAPVVNRTKSVFSFASDIAIYAGKTINPASVLPQEVHFISSSGVANTHLERLTYTDGLDILQHDPTLGVAKRETSGILQTGWFDGGFREMEGSALEVEIHAKNTGIGVSDRIIVQYQLDRDESSWTTLDDFNVASPVQSYAFGGTSPNTAGPGVTFKSIRFQVIPNNSNAVVELIAMVFKYIKRPKIRARYTFDVDVAATAKNLREGPTTEATREAVLDELWAFVDDNPLTAFGYVGEPTKYVMVVGMNRTDILAPEHDDKASIIRVDLIEPVGG